MQIQSQLSGYGYPAKPQIIDRKAADTAARTSETRSFSADAITGSSTFLSSSLSNALWAVEGGRSDQPLGSTPTSIAHVEDVYSEF